MLSIARQHIKHYDCGYAGALTRRRVRENGLLQFSQSETALSSTQSTERLPRTVLIQPLDGEKGEKGVH